MKIFKYLFAFLLLSTSAFSQGSRQIQSGDVTGALGYTPLRSIGAMLGPNITCGAGLSCSLNTMSISGAGSSGQIQFNNSGLLGGFTMTGDATIDTSTGILTLSTANPTPGSFGSASQCVSITTNSKGLITAASQTACATSNYTPPFAGSVQTTVTAKLSEHVSVKDFGADCTGSVDGTSAVSSAISALGASGGEIEIPNGCFVKVSGAGSEIFLITAPIRFACKGLGSSGFLVTASTSATTDIFRIRPASNATLYGTGMTKCQVIPLSGTPGRHVWNFDTSAGGSTTVISEFLAEDNYFGTFGNYTFFNNTNAGVTASGGIYSGHFVRNVCAGSGSSSAGGCFGGANWGDSNHINGGRMAGNGYAVNISMFSAGGAGNFIIENANIVSSGMIKIDGGYKPVIQNNTIEQQLLTNTSTNNAVIDINGGSAQVINPTIVGNLIVVGAGLGNPTPLRIANATTAVIDSNRFTTPSAYAPIVITAASSNNTFGCQNAFSGTGAVSFATNTVAISPCGGQLPGTATNDNAFSGYVGEYVESNIAFGSAVSLVTATAKDVTTISLTAGDWDVEFIPQFTGNTTLTTVNYLLSSISNTANTIDQTNGRFTTTIGYNANIFNYGSPGPAVSSSPFTVRMSLSATTTIHAVVQVSFGGSTCSAYGLLRARRVR